ncbi:hypothetical protein B0H17DRAFT_1209279 [Mycena rosella]|uniref:Uncharacterized protein n=1 Tax=Mycena rosella TaxID=1033263 RepID=A0AAD7GA98_MYCRO|nr:hypothetical protein B0H17DRAFT_1209279 [Mycena rosella]
MGNLCNNIDTFLTLHAILTTTLEDPEHQLTSPEAAAIQHLQDSGLSLKHTKGVSKPNKKPKNPPSKSATRPRTNAYSPYSLPSLTPQELVAPEEDLFVIQMMHGFSAPKGRWVGALLVTIHLPLLRCTLHEDGLRRQPSPPDRHSCRSGPWCAISLVDTESSLLSLIKTGRADAYAAERTFFARRCGAHNCALYIAQNLTLFDPALSSAKHHQMLGTKGEHHSTMQSFLKNQQEPLTCTRNQVFFLHRNFGLAAIIHPSASIDFLGRCTPILSLERPGTS